MATSTTAEQTIDVVTPAAGESVTEGTILEWHVQVGDPIKLDDTIVEISTDKVDVELPSPATGTVSEILVQEGDTVTVGQVIARIAVGTDGVGTSGNGAPQAAADGVSGAATAAPAAEDSSPSGSTPQESEGPASAEEGKTVDVLTPAAGESVTEGTILEWHTKVGELIKANDTIVEISTDKVDVELPAPASGTVSELLVQEGDTVTVGQVIARIVVGATDASAASRPDGSAGPASRATDSPPASSVNGSGGVPGGVKATPVAARAAAVEGVDLANVSGSGPSGQIRKADVLSAGATNGAAQTTSATNSKTAAASSERLKGSAAALARYMEQSLEIPTATSFRTLTVTLLDSRRRELKAGTRKVSFTHLIAYAIARAGTDDMPVMAHHFEEIEGKPHRVEDGQVNLGLAVDVEKKDGSRTLMVPVIRNAGRMRFDAFPRCLRRAGGEGAHEHPHGRRPDGREHDADEPRWPRHGRLRPAADGRPGHDRRHRLDRLPRRPGGHRRDDRRGEGHDDDLDIRPSHHPGGRVGALPGEDRGIPAGRARLLRGRVRGAWRRARPRARGSRARRRRIRGRVGGCGQDPEHGPRRGAPAGGAGRQHAALALPQPRSPRSETGPARLRARGRPRPRPRGARPDARDHREDPGEDPAHVRAGGDAGRRATAPARDLLRHDRV